MTLPPSYFLPSHFAGLNLTIGGIGIRVSFSGSGPVSNEYVKRLEALLSMVIF
jgi:hypothetical protein